MGVTYKLKPEVKEFILEQKKLNPALGCRSLTALVENKFQVKLSKSSINAIIKGAGMSMPVGRRMKKTKFVPEALSRELSRTAEIELEEKAKQMEAEKWARLAEEERRKIEAAQKTLEEKKILKEAVSEKVAEAEKKKAEAQSLAREKAFEQEEARQAQEAARQLALEAARKAAEEISRKIDEEKRALEAAKKAVEDMAKEVKEERRGLEAEKKSRLDLEKLEKELQEKQESMFRQEEELRAKEAQEQAQVERERKEIEEEKRALEEARKSAEELAGRLQEERLALEEEKKALEETQRKEREEKSRREEEEIRAREEEERKSKEEADRKAEEAKRALEEVLRLEEAKKKDEEEKKSLEEAERKVREEAVRRREEELKAEAEAEGKARDEAARKLEALKRSEAAQKAAEEKRLSEEKQAHQAEAEKWARLAEEERQKKEAAQKAEQESATLKAPAMPAEQPVGVRENLPPGEKCSGAILLKAAECLVAGNRAITDVIKNRTGRQKDDLTAIIENLTYLPLLEKGIDFASLSPLSSLVSKAIPPEALQAFLTEMQADKSVNMDILHVFLSALQEARCVKATFSDGNSVFLDGQMHSVWSTQHIPYDFSGCVNNLRGYINKYFHQNIPFNLFMASGYEIPTREFFSFLMSLEAKGSAITKLIIYGNKFEELETITLDQPKKYFYIFGCWPWQFSEQRKVNKIGAFKPMRFPGFNKDLYLAEVELTLTQPVINQSLTLRGCAIKTSPTDKVRQIILSNIREDMMTVQELAGAYLGHWPNLEEAFQDYSHKVELFTYTVGSQRFFSAENLSLKKTSAQDIRALFANYLEALDAYVRWHFLPTGYEDKEFSVLKEQFYDLPATFERQEDRVLITFQPPDGYAYLNELQYVTHRVNEREVILNDGSRLWLST
jgi:hypothetical protein